MSNSRFKFRAWSRHHKNMLEDWQESRWVEDVGFDGGNWYEVMQYTGLKDKNGAEIYEGDIVKGRVGKRNFIVRYIVDGWCLDAGETIRLHDYIYEHGEIEIIGNVYEHPELLEEKE